jgi:hypothetical protein
VHRVGNAGDRSPAVDGRLAGAPPLLVRGIDTFQRSRFVLKRRR